MNNTYITALTTKQVANKVLFPPCLIEHIPLSQIKMTYTKILWNKANVKGEYISGACLSRSNKRKPHISKSKRSE